MRGVSERIAALALAVAGASAAAALAVAPGAAAPLRGTGSEAMVIGAALDISGGWTSLGRASRVTLRLAVRDVNAALAKEGASHRVRLQIEDTRGTAEGARRAVRTLADGGARIVIGPPSSSGVKAVRGAARQQGVLVISQGSTAHSLAVAGDNVFRFVPDDVRESEAHVALLKRHGVDAVVPLWRRDEGNAGLAKSLRRLFTRAGGRVSPGVAYSSTNPNFAPVVAAAAAQAARLRAQGARCVAIYVAAFDEIVDLLRAAEGNPTLAALPWYSTDGVVGSERLRTDRRAAAFAVRVGFRAPTVGISESVRKRAQPVIRRARAGLGHEPDALTLTAYDALRVAARAQRRAGEGAASLRASLTRTANAYSGVTGAMKLNRAGDRAFGTFDFWSVCPAGGGYAWKRTNVYVASAPGVGRIVGNGRC